MHVLAPKSVEDRVALGTEVFNADNPGAEVRQDASVSPRKAQIDKLQQGIHDIKGNPPKKNVSNLDLAAFTSTDDVPEEADGDILPPHPGAHQQELLNRTRANSAVPSKQPKKKMSIPIFNRSKKPGTISGPVGPVTHTGYANAVGRATNFTIPSPAESLKNTASASNDPERVETLKAHSGNAPGVSSPTITSADAAHMQEGITQLQNLAKEKPDRLERLQSETTTAKNGDKSAPLKKSKSMFFNAKQAFVRKFSSTAENDPKKKAQDANTLLETGPYIADPPSSRINLRVAEGTNLGSPKVQALTGNGRIKRKPVPINHSTDCLPGTLDDPFIDRKGKGRYLGSPSSQSSPHVNLIQAGAPPPPMPNFSRQGAVAGLASRESVNAFAGASVSAFL